MAESKSDQFFRLINAHSEILVGFERFDIKRLGQPFRMETAARGSDPAARASVAPNQERQAAPACEGRRKWCLRRCGARHAASEPSAIASCRGCDSGLLA